MEIDGKRFGIGFEGINLYGLVAQLVRAPPCHGGGRGFEPHPGRFYFLSFVYGILAQLGEHLPYKQRVIGSSPIGSIMLVWRNRQTQGT